MSDIQFPNYLNTFVSAAQAGHAAAKDRARQSALATYRTDPAGAQNALVSSGDIEGANALSDLSRRQRQTDAEATAQTQYQAGDSQGALNTLAGAGDNEGLRSYVALDEHKRAVAQDITQRKGAIAYTLSQDFKKDPNLAAQQWEQWIKPEMVKKGYFTQEEADRAPISAANPQGSIAFLDKYANDALTAVQRMEEADRVATRNKPVTVGPNSALVDPATGKTLATGPRAAPAGYRYSDDGSDQLEVIPGGPADPHQVGQIAGARRDAIVSRPMARAGGPGKPQALTPSKVIGPILGKVANGEPLNAGEQELFERYKNGPNNLLGLVAGQPGAPAPQPAPAAQPAPQPQPRAQPQAQPHPGGAANAARVNSKADLDRLSKGAPYINPADGKVYYKNY